MIANATDLKPNRFDIFWGEISPCEHLVQFYQDDAVFLDALEGFVSGGIKAGDGVVIIATPEHRNALEERVRASGVDIVAAQARDQYIGLDAEETLSMFMVDSLPDDFRFQKLVNNLIRRAGRDGRKVRAFGEMVALLWARGNRVATIRLEYLWHRFCQEKAFCLFCAYPKAGFTMQPDEAMKEICAAHSKVLDG